MARSGSGYLNESEFLSAAPSMKGEQVHINHVGCSAGTDTKRRLYVKRNQDGTVVAYCHHCNKRGVSGKRNPVVGYSIDWSAADPLASRRQPSGSGRQERNAPRHPVHQRPLSFPAGASTTAAIWPASARNWVKQFGLSDEELCRKGWAYSEKYNRVLIPVHDPDGGLLGYQSRRLEDDGSPKYMTFKDKTKNVHRLYYEVRPRKCGTVVLVEDALSAEKVGRYADAVAVLTTTADSVLRDKIISVYDHVVVWLDDDNIDVKRKQLQLHTMFDPYVKVSVLRTTKDPKRHNFEEIEEILNGYSS